jgi:hypothetical protein
MPHLPMGGGATQGAGWAACDPFLLRQSPIPLVPRLETVPRLENDAEPARLGPPVLEPECHTLVVQSWPVFRPAMQTRCGTVGRHKTGDDDLHIM